jgi:hypothetical protein
MDTGQPGQRNVGALSVLARAEQNVMVPITIRYALCKNGWRREYVRPL